MTTIRPSSLVRVRNMHPGWANDSSPGFTITKELYDANPGAYVKLGEEAQNQAIWYGASNPGFIDANLFDTLATKLKSGELTEAQVLAQLQPKDGNFVFRGSADGVNPRSANDIYNNTGGATNFALDAIRIAAGMKSNQPNAYYGGNVPSYSIGAGYTPTLDADIAKDNAGNKSYSKGTTLYHQDGSTTTSDGSTQYGSQWSTTKPKETSTETGNHPKGTVLLRDDGVKFISDGRTVYGKSYKPTGETSNATPGPILQTVPSATGASISPVDNSLMGQAQAIQQKLNIMAQAQQAGMQITPQTTFEQAQQFVTTGGTVTGGLPNGIGNNLPPDQKAVLQSIYDAIVQNDSETADRIKAAMEAAKEFSDPYFKAQIRLVEDALDRALSGKAEDLAYSENKLGTILNDLKQDVASSRDMLSFQEVQELKGLERQLTQERSSLRNNLAATGFTSSSVRNKKEQLMEDTAGDLRQSTQRTYGFKQNQLTDQGLRGARDTASEIARLRQLTESGKLDLIRSAEEKIGSGAIASKGLPSLGGVQGSIARNSYLDQLSFANSAGFVF